MTTGPSKLRARLFTVFFMFIVTLVCISVVSAVHLGSRERVARNEALYLMQGIMAAAGREVPADPAAVLDWYQACVTARPEAAAPLGYEIRAREDGAPLGFVFLRRGAGLWGTIEAAVGLDTALKHFTGIAFINQNETPGLGARIMEPWYGEQIKGKTGGLKLAPEGTRSADPAELDAITGATITSAAVRDILNTLIDEAPALAGAMKEATDGSSIQ